MIKQIKQIRLTDDFNDFLHTLCKQTYSFGEDYYYNETGNIINVYHKGRKIIINVSLLPNYELEIDDYVNIIKTFTKSNYYKIRIINDKRGKIQ